MPLRFDTCASEAQRKRYNWDEYFINRNKKKLMDDQALRRSLGFILLLLASLQAHGDAESWRYEVVYTAEFTADTDTVAASIRIGEGAEMFREMRFDFDPERFSDFEANGELTVEGNELKWRPGEHGGTLTFNAVLTNQRSSGSYDARITEDWALFRGNDIFPAATTRVLKNTYSDSRLIFKLPNGWSSVTRYERSEREHTYLVNNPERDFDRPTGWMLAGKLGVRRDTIGDTHVTIAAPVGQNFRRMDVMGFLNWTLPSIRKVFPTMDERLLIVAADDPMWRGGLSGPGSLYVHSDRPLISENGTSTFLHELGHVAMGASGSDHDDWLLEGLAEYYSVKILAETGTLSERRRKRTMKDLEEWGSDVDNLFVRHSSGEVTARATVALAELDAALAKRAPGDKDLDDVVAAMIKAGGTYNYQALCTAAHEVMQGPVPELSGDAIPGAGEGCDDS